MTKPVALFVFNRPEQTTRTFAAIRAARPAMLLLVADGPRPGNPRDELLCDRVRQIVTAVDWPCDVSVNFASTNMGCRRRLTSGLDWVFQHVDSAIILEDDCLPHPDFFSYCNTLLDRYADDERVMAVTGNNFQEGERRGEASYYFSRYVHVWGWATWRRAWLKNDPALSFWPEWRGTAAWRAVTSSPEEERFWRSVFDRAREGRVDTWDYAWLASVWYHRGLTATPNVNLVRNIGFDAEATHTRRASSRLTPAVEALGSIEHPIDVRRDAAADRYVFDHVFDGRKLRGIARYVSGIKRTMYRIMAAVPSRVTG